MALKTVLLNIRVNTAPITLDMETIKIIHTITAVKWEKIEQNTDRIASKSLEKSIRKIARGFKSIINNIKPKTITQIANTIKIVIEINFIKIKLEIKIEYTIK